MSAPRLRAEIWVSALLRRCQAQGHFGALVRKGAAEAGAVFVTVNHLDGTCHLFGPAPGPAYDDAGDRRFVEALPPPASEADARALLARRVNQDPDIWIVEIEDRMGTAGIIPTKD